MESDAVKRQLREKEERLKQAAPKSELETLQKEVAKKQTEILKLQKELLSWRLLAAPLLPPKLLRSQPLANLSVEGARKMLQEKNFFESRYSKSGKGLQHQYEKIEREGQSLVIDHATGLTWQQAGSSNRMAYANAEKFVRELNAKIFWENRICRYTSLCR